MTYAVGIGGSILVIGSAAGVVAMSKVKELTFVAYLKYTPVVFLVYALGMGITYIVA
jgi:Na+/H+ antiporter NhaD/arsenite permease-like protein